MPLISLLIWTWQEPSQDRFGSATSPFRSTISGRNVLALVGLDDFPFVEVKVDRQFVAGCADDRLKRTACRQILEIADGFGCRTVAEGIETRADFFAVREMDFDMVQGF